VRMSKRWWGIVAGVAALGLTFAVALWVDRRATDNRLTCPEKLAADEAKVRTDKAWGQKDLPGTGDYVEIHWMAKALGNPCSLVPGPTDWLYRGVVKLRAEDAKALHGSYGDWQPGTPDIPTDLLPYAPAGVQWQRAEEYDAVVDPKYHRSLHLDPERALAYFTLSSR